MATVTHFVDYDTNNGTLCNAKLDLGKCDVEKEVSGKLVRVTCQRCLNSIQKNGIVKDRDEL